MSFVVQRVVTKEHYSSIISTKESLFSKLEIHEVRRGNHITLHIFQSFYAGNCCALAKYLVRASRNAKS